MGRIPIFILLPANAPATTSGPDRPREPAAAWRHSRRCRQSSRQARLAPACCIWRDADDPLPLEERVAAKRPGGVLCDVLDFIFASSTAARPPPWPLRAMARR